MTENREAAAEAPRGCGRGEELVAYLYGEATKEEAGLFGRHLDACAACRAELASFGGVREGLAAWRADALGAVPPLNIEEALAPAARVPTAAPRRRSARAALREFFSLSPLWLRAGACAATLALCALAALTLARAEVRLGPDGLAFGPAAAGRVVKERVEVPVQVGYTEEQVNAIVSRKVAEAKAQLVAGTKEQGERRRPDQVVNVNASRANPPQAPSPNAARRKRATRPAQGRDDSLLAEDNLPRLSDLLSGSY